MGIVVTKRDLERFVGGLATEAFWLVTKFVRFTRSGCTEMDVEFAAPVPRNAGSRIADNALFVVVFFSADDCSCPMVFVVVEFFCDTSGNSFPLGSDAVCSSLVMTLHAVPVKEHKAGA